MQISTGRPFLIGTPRNFRRAPILRQSALALLHAAKAALGEPDEEHQGGRGKRQQVRTTFATLPHAMQNETSRRFPVTTPRLPGTTRSM